MNYINLNGKIQPGDQPALLVSNRGYRYGDGLFETIRVSRERILLEAYHFERLFSGISLLKFETPERFNAGKLSAEILDLCKKNACGQNARVRLSLFRGNGGLYDEHKRLQYIIECWPLPGTVNTLNENGLVIGLYRGVSKNCDDFSNLKTASFLPYNMAAVYAEENKLNDCLVLNTHGHIADSSKANVFVIKDDVISTPSLKEGCVNGVMRRYLAEQLRSSGYELREETLTVGMLEEAGEVFMTNAIQGLRWVKEFAGSTYSCSGSAEIFNRFIKTLFA